MEDEENATAGAPIAAGGRAPARLVLAGGVALVLVMAARTPSVDVQSRPKRNDEVVARLPARSSPAESTLARLRAASEAAPGDLDRALALAQGYLEAARRDGDPRYLGAAEGALQPFVAGGDPLPEVRLLRATMLQSRHEFDAALDDLDRALAVRPQDSQAWLTRASVWLVKGGYEEARTSCARLVGLTSPAVALCCAASVDAFTGEGPRARAALARALSLATSPLEQSYAHSLWGEQAYWSGELEEGETHLRAALASDPSDRYTRTVLADLLLDAGRAREVLALSAASTTDDALLLRLGLAARALRRDDADAQLDALAARFEESRLRGDAVHRREEARLWLARGKPDRALACALESWGGQKEPWDARLVLEAAAQSGRAAEAASVVAWLDRTRFASPRLRSLVASLGAVR